MKRMRKKKNRYRIAALCIAMFCVAAAWVNKDQCWKLFSQTINTKQFEAVSRRNVSARLFVDQEGIVVEPPIAVSIYW